MSRDAMVVLGVEEEEAGEEVEEEVMGGVEVGMEVDVEGEEGEEGLGTEGVSYRTEQKRDRMPRKARVPRMGKARDAHFLLLLCSTKDSSSPKVACWSITCFAKPQTSSKAMCLYPMAPPLTNMTLSSTRFVSLLRRRTSISIKE
jgi:hypothetical protein